MTGQTSLAMPHLTFISGANLTSVLMDRVLSGEWAAGRQLPSERVLAQEFTVSRPVVREALRALRERGLIEVSAGRGSFVREVRLTADGGNADLVARQGGITARHLIVARTMLEGESAALAAQHRSAQDLQQMRKLLSAFAQAPSDVDAVDLDVAFHESVAVAAANPVIQLMFGSIRNLTHGAVLRSLTDPKVRSVAVPLHEVIFAAIRDQEPDGARAAMVEHIGAATAYYGPDLDSPLADVLHRRAERSPDLRELMERVSAAIASETPASHRGDVGPAKTQPEQP